MVTEGKALPFDQLLATEKTVGWFRMHGRTLGPKGLMPNDKQGTLVHNFATHGTAPPPTAKKAKIKKGIEIKLQQRSHKDSFLRIVVGKVPTNLPLFLPFLHPSCSPRDCLAADWGFSSAKQTTKSKQISKPS